MADAAAGLLVSTLRAPAAALGLIEGVADGLAGAARLAGGALADDPARRRAVAVGGYTAPAVLAGSIGVASTVGPNISVLIVAFLVRVAGIGFVETAQHAAITTHAPADLRGSAFGLLAGIQSLGTTVGVRCIDACSVQLRRMDAGRRLCCSRRPTIRRKGRRPLTPTIGAIGWLRASPRPRRAISPVKAVLRCAWAGARARAG
jgi:nitrate/nitrite transporter NarK